MTLLLVVLVAAGCATRGTPAPVVDARGTRTGAAKPVLAPVPAPAPKPAGDLYSVRRGDTLYSIALEHGADYRDLAQWNQLEDPTRLRIGQQLRVAAPPEAERATAQVGAARIAGRVESRPLESRPLESSVQPAPPAAQVIQKEAPKPELTKSAQPQAIPFPISSALFMWPTKGKVLAEFAEPRRKGIDIDGRPGDPVVAAAAGRVTYIGTGIPGMGKLVVIKHENGFITVYGHNRDILVKEQQAVARGQEIAKLGSTDSERPKLHFQIRKGASAVDPLLYLPKT
jgi:lipoprotein NlpD